MSAKYDTRNLSIVDILRAKQLTEAGAVLDAQVRCTSSEAGLNTALISSMIPLTSRHTLVARVGAQRVVGQFYITQDGKIARLVYLAPGLEERTPDDAWLLMLDAIAQEAGRRGAHVVTGEVDEDTHLFKTMRQSGFAVYARQKLWVIQPKQLHVHAVDGVTVQRATEDHTARIYALYRRMVPRLLQQVSQPPSMNGFVYMEGNEVVGFVNLSEGRDGVMLTPYIDPRARATSDDILQAVLAALDTGKRVITVRVPRHQGWLGSSLEALGFACAAEQAVMVRHIAAGVHSVGFRSLEEKYAAATATRQTGELPELCCEITLPAHAHEGHMNHDEVQQAKVPHNMEVLHR